MKPCPLCFFRDEEILLQTDYLRVIAVHNEPNAPAICRVIWQQHIAEMTDLSALEQHKLMTMVFRVEAAMRQVLQPVKINLAQLGNQVPHLHWHIIARFEQDACFPASIWANPVRVPNLNLPKDWSNQVKQLLKAA